MEKKVYSIAVTGGPCSGKTTFMSYAPEKLWEHGIRPFVIPEMATLLIHPGIRDISQIERSNRALFLEIERMIFASTHMFTKNIRALSRNFSEEKIVIIHDRGLKDVEAYVEKSEFEKIAAEHGLKVGEIHDMYECVVHLVTAGHGAEKFYTTDNNPARREKTPEEARCADKRTLNAWIGHHNLCIIDNSGPFDVKMERGFKEIMRTLGAPVPVMQKKYVLDSLPNLESGGLGQVQRIFIEQCYLPRIDDAREVRIRKRSWDTYYSYYKSITTRIAPGERIQTQHMIDEKEYASLVPSQDPKTHVIKKWRYCFAYNYQYFRLDVFVEPYPQYILEVELTEKNQQADIPPFFRISADITGDPRYTNYAIAHTS